MLLVVISQTLEVKNPFKQEKIMPQLTFNPEPAFKQPGPEVKCIIISIIKPPPPPQLTINRLSGLLFMLIRLKLCTLG